MLSIDRTQPRHYGQAEKRYYGVTQVCEALAAVDGRFFPAGSAERGTDVHLIFALSVAAYAGLSQPPVVLPDYHGYHESMLHWIERVKPEPMWIEHPSLSLTAWSFAGTPDLLAWVQEGRQRLLAMIEVKSGQKARWHAVQVQAYAHLADYRRATGLRLLYLNPDGGPPITEVVRRNPRDLAAFHSTLNMLLWRDSR